MTQVLSSTFGKEIVGKLTSVHSSVPTIPILLPEENPSYVQCTQRAQKEVYGRGSMKFTVFKGVKPSTLLLNSTLSSVCKWHLSGSLTNYYISTSVGVQPRMGSLSCIPCLGHRESSFFSIFYKNRQFVVRKDEMKGSLIKSLNKKSFRTNRTGRYSLVKKPPPNNFSITRINTVFMVVF